MVKEERFADVEKMLEAAGYRLARIHGSRHCFTKLETQPVSIPVYKGKVKPYYVRQVDEIRQGN